MIEKVKDKDAEPEQSKTDELQEGLEGTFPGSDPVSTTQPRTQDEKKKDET